MRIAIIFVAIVLIGASAVIADDAAAWSAQPDPALPADVTDKVNLRLTFPVKITDTLKFPSQLPSISLIPFVTINAADECKWNSLDLHAGKIRLGSTAGHLQNVVVSADAKYVAGWGVDVGQTCQVWSLTQNKRLISLDADASRIPAALGFHGKQDLFLSYLTARGESTVTQTDLDSGKPVRSYKLPAEITAEGSCQSPGGKYLAVLGHIGKKASGQALYICDLDSGTVVGNTALLPSGLGFPVGLAFSPTGDKVAALFVSGLQHRLLEWNFATGELAADQQMNLDLDPFPTQGPILQLLPDGKSLRISHFVYDLQTGKLLATIAPPVGKPSDPNKLLFAEMLSDKKTLILFESPAGMNKTIVMQTQRVDR